MTTGVDHESHPGFDGLPTAAVFSIKKMFFPDAREIRAEAKVLYFKKE